MNGRTQGFAIAALLVCMLTTNLAAAATENNRPLPTRNLYPPMMRFFDPIPDSALRPFERKWRVQLLQHYSTVNLFDAIPSGSLLVDMELYVLDAMLTRAITNTLDISLRLPVLRPNNGVFDAPIEHFHNFFGMPNGGREKRPHNVMSYRFDNGQGSHWKADNRWELGNAVVSLRRQLAAGQGWSTAALAAIKLPTASETRGWGSGAADAGAGALYSWQRGNWFSHLEGWYIHPWAAGATRLHYRDYMRASASLGWQYASWPVTVVQVQGGSSPYQSGVSQLDTPPFLIAFGIEGFTDAETGWSLTITENITQRTTQDISISFGLFRRYR